MQSTNNINLQSILDLSTQLNETKDVKSILNLCVLSLIGKLGITKAIAYTHNKDKFLLELTKGFNPLNNNEKNINNLINKIPKNIDFLLSLDNSIDNNSNANSDNNLNDNFDVQINNSKVKNKIIEINDEKLIRNGLSYVLPIYYSDNLIAVICLGKKILKNILSEEEIFYVNLVLNITSSALQNAKNYSNLLSQKDKTDKRNQLLQTLFEISKDFGFFSSQENILKNFGFSLMGQLQLTRYMLVCFDFKFGVKSTNIKQNRFAHNINENNLLPLWDFDKTTDLRFLFKIELYNSDNELNYDLLNIKNKNIFDKISQNKDFRHFIIENGINFIIPVFVQGQRKGAVLIGKKLTTKYSLDEIRFVESLGNTAITAIENLRLFREELEKKKIDSEIKIALEIQKNLLPKSDPIIEGIDIAGITLASRYVGGDYYDYLKINEDIYFIIIADVTGKGIPASILMANIQSAVKLLCYTDNEPAIIAVKLNKLVCSNTTIDKFASVFMGFLNIKEKSLQFVNAGHNPPFIYNKFNDEVQFLSTENMLIGVLENNIYNSKKVFFKSGDILVMYTDGVVEAQYNNQEFSEEKLINLVKNNSDASAKEIINTFLAEINFRPDNTNLYDDVTKIIMKF
jgi:sigma-B regulation protein RsbU (phosphoserine phosphatase)